MEARLERTGVEVTHRGLQFVRLLGLYYLWAINLWFASLMASWLLTQLDAGQFFVVMSVLSLVGGLFVTASTRSLSAGAMVAGIGIGVSGVMALAETVVEAFFVWVTTGGVEFSQSALGLGLLLGIPLFFGVVRPGPAVWNMAYTPLELLGLVGKELGWNLAKAVFGLIVVLLVSYGVNNATTALSGLGAFGVTFGIAVVVGAILIAASRDHAFMAGVVIIVGALLGIFFGVIREPLELMTSWILNEGVTFFRGFWGVSYLIAYAVVVTFGDDNDDDDD